MRTSIFRKPHETKPFCRRNWGQGLTTCWLGQQYSPKKLLFTLFLLQQCYCLSAQVNISWTELTEPTQFKTPPWKEVPKQDPWPCLQLSTQKHFFSHSVLLSVGNPLKSVELPTTVHHHVTAGMAVRLLNNYCKHLIKKEKQHQKKSSIMQQHHASLKYMSVWANTERFWMWNHHCNSCTITTFLKGDLG